VTELKKKFEVIAKKYEREVESLMPFLQDIQEEFHYLPEESLKEVAQRLAIPLNRVFSVATFYNAFSLKPKGKYVIQVCMGTACHIKGAPLLLEEISSLLGVREGGTTEDRLFSVETVRCLGCCSLAPVININGNAYGNLSPEKIGSIINEYKR
jgi:NADH-quinone oxidoreductase subunit E